MRKWTKEKDEVLIRLYPTAMLESLAFRLGVSKKALKQRANKLGIYRANGKKPWIQKDLDYLREHYVNDSAPEIAAVLGRVVRDIYQKAAEMHLRKAPDFFRMRGKINAQHPLSVAARFKNGCEPHNKGKKIEEYMSEEGLKRSSATRFKNGHVPKNARPVGFERLDKNGYVWAKVPGQRTMTLKHRWVWKTHNGKIPEGYMVAFKDGNRQNCAISNLYLLSKADNARNIYKRSSDVSKKRNETKKKNINRDRLRTLYGLKPIGNI